MASRYTLRAVAEIVGGTVRGDDRLLVDGVADVSQAAKHQITFIQNSRYADAIKSSQAGAVLVPEGFGPTPMPAILCPNVFRSVARLLSAFGPPGDAPPVGVHPTALIHESAVLGSGVTVGPYAVLGAECRVGDGSVLHPGVRLGRRSRVGVNGVLGSNVVIGDDCELGDRVVVHANSVIGSDGFGYYLDNGRHHRVPHIGGVRIEDEVEIGACTCIDRAKFGCTLIGRGTKIDNQVHIAHNVHIGQHCLITAQCGFAGSARTGDDCVFGGRSAVLDNVTVGNRVTIAALAVVSRDIGDGETVSGFPARDHHEELRERVLSRRLPEWVKQLKEVTARVEGLESSAHHQA